MSGALTDTNDIKRYKVSLRLWHPTMDPDEISASLALTPSISWRRGEQRRSSKGEVLDGSYDQSYWSGSLSADSNPQGLVDTLELYLLHLENRAKFMREFHHTGGNAEFFVGWFGTGGATFTWDLLERCAFLGIELGIDVYGDD